METTGQVISRLGVLTVLSTNMVEENRLQGAALKAAKREVLGIVNGVRGIEPGKVTARSVERCKMARFN